MLAPNDVVGCIDNSILIVIARYSWNSPDRPRKKMKQQHVIKPANIVLGASKLASNVKILEVTQDVLHVLLGGGWATQAAHSPTPFGQANYIRLPRSIRHVARIEH